jgi:hypothetical protein
MSIHKLLFCEKNKEKVEIGGVFMRQADVEFTVRTDLALEEREKVQGSEIPGIRVREWEKEETGIRVTEVAVCDERGEKALGKSVGMYLTVEAASLAKKDDDYHREVSEELAGLLRGMLKEHGLETEKMGRPVRTLVVGLGNPEATPDALGPKVLEHLQATRHLELEYGTDFCRKHGYPVLSGADGDGDGGDRERHCAGDGAGCSDRCGCVGGEKCRETGSHGAAIRYGDPAGIRGRESPERADGGDTGDSCVCDRDPDGRRGGGDRV